MKMENFKVFNVDGFDKDVIFLNTIEDLYFIKDEIFQELSKKNGDNFKVIIDHFLTNGFSFNRFSILCFNGNENTNSYIINPRDVPEQIKNQISLYLKENFEVLEESSLPLSIKEFIKNTNNKI